MNNQQNVNISMEDTVAVECSECSSMYFEQALHIRKASGLLTGQAKPSYMPIPVFRCVDCGHINSEFLPKEIR